VGARGAAPGARPHGRTKLPSESGRSFGIGSERNSGLAVLFFMFTDSNSGNSFTVLHRLK